jgi:hypothetical protein
LGKNFGGGKFLSTGFLVVEGRERRKAKRPRKGRDKLGLLKT